MTSGSTRPACSSFASSCKQSPVIVSRRRLEAVLWQGEPPASDSLRSNLYLLRQAVDKPFDRPLIHTHPGLGWSVADLPDSVS